MIPHSMTGRFNMRNRSEIRLMSMKLFLVLGSLLFVHPLSATKDTSLDRISRLIAQSSKSPALVDALLELAEEYGRPKIDSAILSLEEALWLSRDLEYLEGELSTLTQLTIASKNAREYEKAFQYGKEGLILSKGLSRPDIEARLLNTLGTAFDRSKLPDSAIVYYYKSLDLSLQHHDLVMASKVYNNLGIFFTSDSRGELNDAKRNFLESYKITVTLQDTTSLIRSQLNLGGIYAQLNKNDSASFYLSQAARLCRKQGNMRQLGQILNNIAVIKKREDKHEEALQLFHEILEINQETGNPDQIVVVLQNIGFSYIKMKDYSLAIPYLREAMELATRANLDARLVSIHESMASAYEGLDIYDSAITHLRRYTELEKRFFNESKARAVEDANIKYETAEQEKRLILAREEREARKNERNTFISVSIFLAALLSLGYAAFRTKQQANIRLAAQKTIIENKEQEKTLLLRELHHRVKNNLQLISSLLNLQAYQLKDKAAASAVKEGQARVEAMAMIHRQLYLKEEETKISLPEYLESMMQNLLYAFGKESGNVTVDKQVVDLQIDADLAIPLGLIINELLTNSLKYAFKDTPTPRLTLKAERLPQQLLIQVADNGPGVTGETKRKTSFGMEMVKSLAKQLKAELEINQEAGHSVSLRIPFNTSSSDLMPSHA